MIYSGSIIVFLNLLILLLNVAGLFAHVPPTCGTTSGQTCPFPFKFKGRTYTHCTTKDSESGRPWCATYLTSDGQVVPNYWGDCNSACAIYS